MQLCMHTCRHDMHTPLQTLSNLTARYEIHVNSISHEARARKRTPRANKMYLQVYLQVYLQCQKTIVGATVHENRAEMCA